MIDINDSKSMADCWYVNIMAIRIHFLEIVLNFMKSHTHGLWSGQHCYLFIVFFLFTADAGSQKAVLHTQKLIHNL